MAVPVLTRPARRASLPGVPAASRGIDRFRRPDSFGSVTGILAAISAGVNLVKGAATLAPQLKARFKKEAEEGEVWKVRMLRAERRFKKASTPAAKKRARRQFVRYRERWHLAKIRQGLVAERVAEGGPLLEGTALEVRRNMLVNEWDAAGDAGKVEIEKLIKGYDERIAKLHRQWKGMQGEQLDPTPGAPALEPPAGSGARLGSAPESAEWMPKLHPGPILADKSPVTPNQALVTGMGGLGFVSTSPNPPGNLARVSFYPVVPAQSYAGANGIVEPGDDPVLLMTLTSAAAGNFVLSADYIVETELFDYGKYRVLGLQANHQSNFVVKDSTGANRTTAVVQGCAVTVRSLQVYNGEELLLPLGELDVHTFDIFGTPDGGYPGISATSLSAFRQQAPYNFRARSKGFFMGLRTNPVMEGTAKLRMVVRAFTVVTTNDAGVAATGFLAGDYLEVPVSFNLVADILEDKVFGDPLVPSPASRAGAQVRLGLKELGRTTRGTEQVQMVNPGYRPPLLGGPTSS